MDFNNEFPIEQVVSAPQLTLNLQRTPILYYSHGWQSWSLSSWTEAGKPQPVQKPKLLHAMQLDPNYAYHPHPHGSWVGAVELEQDNIILLGSLGLDAHVELNKKQLHGWYELGTGEWFIGHGNEQTVFSRYADLLGQRLGRANVKAAPRVWCSWYSLYTTIDEQSLFSVFDNLKELPFDVIQVDDGWQIAIGDWEANNKFSSGMTLLADKIKFTGRKAGLWIAPTIAVKSSKLFQNHPTWFLRDRNGKFTSAGFNWGEQLFALDTTHPEALFWLSELMKQVRQWGFDYVKLDFLYASALPGKRKVDIPREAAYRNGLKVLREALGEDAFLLACGAPIMPSLGLCDALRIGPDVADTWENTRDAILLNNPTIPGTKNAIRTTVHRLWLKQLVSADPDVVYFRSRECRLTEENKSMLQSLALICNYKSTSDIPQWLANNERERLRDFLNSKPKITQVSRYIYQIDNLTLDFSSAISLSPAPLGLDLIKSIVINWLGNQEWVLKIMYLFYKFSLLKINNSF
jgi:alpha-galactosidase